MPIVIENGSLLRVPHEFVERLGVSVFRTHFIEQLAGEVNDVEQIVDHDDILLSMLHMHVIVVLALRVVVVTALLSGLPNLIEDELALL